MIRPPAVVLSLAGFAPNDVSQCLPPVCVSCWHVQRDTGEEIKAAVHGLAPVGCLFRVPRGRLSLSLSPRTAAVTSWLFFLSLV